MNVAEMVNGSYSEARILAEVELCELVCSNCHRVRSQQRWLQEIKPPVEVDLTVSDWRLSTRGVCSRGHLLVEPNIRNGGGRRCRACLWGWNRVYKGRQKNLTLDIDAEADRAYAEIMPA